MIKSLESLEKLSFLTSASSYRLVKLIAKLYDKIKNTPNIGIRNYAVGACIFEGKQIISFGFNTSKTHPLQKSIAVKVKASKRECLHAEVDAILKAKKTDLSRATLLVIRIKKDGSLGIAKPCSVCSSLIKKVKIKKVIYS